MKKLVRILGMEAYGECIIEEFGKGELFGKSVIQLRSISCISTHLAPNSDETSIDIFSCKEYNPDEAVKFCQKFFSSHGGNVSVLMRGCENTE